MKSKDFILPELSVDLIGILDDLFPTLLPAPNKTSLEALMYNSGQRNVVEFMKYKLAESHKTMFGEEPN